MLANQMDCPSQHKPLLNYQLDHKDICQCLNRCRARIQIWVNVLSLPNIYKRFFFGVTQLYKIQLQKWQERRWKILNKKKK